MRSTEQANASSSLSTYLSELQNYPLLTAAEEQRLARKYRKGDLVSGHALVTANLRFVVKVAYEYRSYGLRMADLIQEGNIGLVKAVQKFDPNKKIRLISYAVWWIRAYVQSHILKSWSLVKLGTTQAQRRLFFSLARASLPGRADGRGQRNVAPRFPGVAQRSSGRRSGSSRGIGDGPLACSQRIETPRPKGAVHHREPPAQRGKGHPQIARRALWIFA